MPTDQAREDLRDKLTLEQKLRVRIDVINRRIVRETARKYGQSGDLLDAALFKDDIEQILLEHYSDTAKVFDNKLRKELPQDIEITEEESETIAAAVAIFSVARSGDQSQIITDTNQKDINESILNAQNTAQEDALAGVSTSQQEIAVLAAAALSRKLIGRAGTIASFETQAAAETFKGTEAEVLIGQDPSVLVGSPRPTAASKEWVTVGDEKVRTAHMMADGQVVNINQPFTVGGESLRWPGDTSLGASLENTINCRCASVYDPETVFAVRRESTELFESIQESL